MTLHDLTCPGWYDAGAGVGKPCGQDRGHKRECGPGGGVFVDMAEEFGFAGEEALRVGRWLAFRLNGHWGAGHDPWTGGPDEGVRCACGSDLLPPLVQFMEAMGPGDEWLA